MDISTLLMFAAAVLPLIFTPGPDLLFVASQALTGGYRSAVRANAGVISGYVVHAILGGMGVAAIVAASPILFSALRWTGIAYLIFLAIKMFLSALRRGVAGTLDSQGQPASLFKGFLTSFLNPKGLLVYLTILPAFMNPSGNVVKQSLMLSAVFIGLCAIVYGIVGLAIASMKRKGSGSDKLRRATECFAGGMLIFAAVRMASR